MTTDIDKRCTCSGPGAYYHECPVGLAPHFIRVFNSPEDHDLYMKISTLAYTPTGGQLIHVFQFEMENSDGAWTETFGSREVAQGFAVGYRAALTMANGYGCRILHVPEHAYRPPPIEMGTVSP